MAQRIIVALLALIVIVGGIIWLVNRDKETPTPVLSVAAFNQTKNASATEVSTSAQDTIIYTLNAENQTDEQISGYIIEANIADITNKATLVDASGASYNAATNSLVWTPRDIPAHESISQSFTVKVNPLAAGTTDTTLRIRFNNEIAVSIQPGQVAGNNTNPGGYIAPTTGVSEYLPALLALMTLVVVAALRKYKLINI